MARWIFATQTATIALTSSVRAGGVTTFENFGLPPHSFDNNAGPSGMFVIDGNQFNNSFNQTFGSWTGWAISSMTDTTTPGFGNQYSAIPGSGADHSQTYAVAFPFDVNADPLHPADSFINLAPGTKPESVAVTNTTYAYLSMLNGDQFAKKFGAGDFLLLDVRGFAGAEGKGKLIGEVDFYLANFLGSNHDIVNTWQTLNLQSLAGAGSLQFGLQSSDNGSFGINTPAFFAIDNLTLGSAAVPEPGSLMLLGIGAISALALIGKRRRL